MTQTDPVQLEQDRVLVQLLGRPEVQTLIAKGTEQKQVGYQEFLAALPEDEFDERQVDAVYRHLIEIGIKIVNEEEPETEPQETELADIEIERARIIVEGWKQALREGRGVFTIENKMIDAPLVAVQEKLLERARRAGKL